MTIGKAAQEFFKTGLAAWQATARRGRSGGPQKAARLCHYLKTRGMFHIIIDLSLEFNSKWDKRLMLTK